MKLLSLVFASVLVFGAASAQAGIMLEPYAGYGIGTWKNKTANSKGDINTGAIGARVAYTFTMLWLGADGSTNVGGKLKTTSGGTGTDDLAGTNVYAVVGADLPLVRFWGGYGLSNTMTDKSSSGDAKLTGGTHFKLGAGLKLIPMISLNLEYMNDAYKKADVPGFGKVDQDVDSSTFMLSASIPFNF